MASNRSIVVQFLRLQAKQEKKYTRQFIAALRKQYNSVLDKVGNVPNDQLKQTIELSVKEQPIEDIFVRLYPDNGLANALLHEKDLLKNFNNKIQTKQSFNENIFLAQMRNYALTEAGFRITLITDKTRNDILGAVESALLQASEDGLSVDNTSKLIRKFLKDNFGEISRVRANAIARTELATSANSGADAAARNTGLTLEKGWSTSGLPGIRSSHLDAESQGFIPMNSSFVNGLKFPGDPSGSAEEVINCRCTILYREVGDLD